MPSRQQRDLHLQLWYSLVCQAADACRDAAPPSAPRLPRAPRADHDDRPFPRVPARGRAIYLRAQRPCARHYTAPRPGRAQRTLTVSKPSCFVVHKWTLIQ
jgi:hypothetical protein